jgi:prevent-host-death family protein
MTKKELAMRTINLADAKTHLSELVTQVASGEEIVITRHGRPIARLAGLDKTKQPLASRARFRAKLPKLQQSSADLLREMRDEAR